MLIERTGKEIIIPLRSSLDTEDLQDFLNYARYKELTSDLKVDQKEVDKLTTKINNIRWTKNRNNLSSEDYCRHKYCFQRHSKLCR